MKYGLEIGLALLIAMTLGSFPLIARINTGNPSSILQENSTSSITIPAGLTEDITIEDLNKSVERGLILSATENEDGSITCVITKQQHDELLEELKQTMDEGIDNIITEFPDIDQIEHNDDYSVFSVKMNTDNVDLTSSIAALGLALYSGLYHVFDGKSPENFRIDYYSSTGELLNTYPNRSDDNMASEDIEASEEPAINEAQLEPDYSTNVSQTESDSNNSTLLYTIPITVYSGYFGQTANKPLTGYGIDPNLRYKTVQQPQTTQQQQVQESDNSTHTGEQEETEEIPQQNTTENTNTNNVNTSTTNTPTHNGSKVAQNDIIFNGEGVIITYKGIGVNEYNDMPYIELYIENTTPEVRKVFSDDTSVNGYMVYGDVTSSLEPNKVMFSEMEFSSNDFQKAGIKSLEQVETTLYITDNDYNNLVEQKIVMNF